MAAVEPDADARRCGWRWSGCPGSPTSPTSTRWPPSRGWTCWSPPTRGGRRRRPCGAARVPRHGRPIWAGCATRGLAAAIERRARRGAPVLGICGGYQMLAATIADEVESRCRRAGRARTCCRSRSRFAADKVLGRPSGSLARAPGHRRTRSTTAWPRWPRRGRAVPGRLPGRSGLGHHVARRLRERRRSAGPGWPRSRRRAGRPGGRRRTRRRTRARRETMIDILADAVEEHLDLDLLLAGTRIGTGSMTDQVLVIGIGSGSPAHLTARGDRRAEPGRRVPGGRQGRGQARSGRAPGRALPGGDRP